jgi:hypothetical protein
MAPRKRILHFEVVSDAQAAELDAAWQEVLSGKRTRLDTAAEEINEIMERAMTGLQRILQAIEEHPGTGQAGRLARFLAGVYNGSDYPFDLTDLRVLDTELASACIDYLSYDRLAKAEVHSHLPDRGAQMERLIAQYGIRPRLHLSSREEHESRLHALAGRLDRQPDAILEDALGDLLARYEAQAFGGLLGSQTPPDEERPLVHASLLSESTTQPLCGAADGPWSPRAFDFLRLACPECRTLLLHPEPASD